MPYSQPAPITNLLLAALPNQDRQNLLAGCEPVDLTFGEVLARPGGEIRYVYFPTGSFISITTQTAGCASLEVGLVGDEGMLGIPLILGVDISPIHASVQGAGPALRMDAALFRREYERSRELQWWLKRYVYVLICQLAQTAACSHFHVVEARLARWLLMTQDRTHSSQFHFTQELLAAMLGVRRVGVTKAATALQNRHLIGYSRGEISILDREGLKTVSCGCYKAQNDIYARMMGKNSTPSAEPTASIFTASL